MVNAFGSWHKAHGQEPGPGPRATASPTNPPNPSHGGLGTQSGTPAMSADYLS